MESSLRKSQSDILMEIMADALCGVIMSYFGWNGKDDVRASRKLLSAFIALTHEGLKKDLVIQLNDSGMSFDEIADYLDSSNDLANLK